jgi:hypothetical protein
VDIKRFFSIHPEEEFIKFGCVYFLETRDSEILFVALGRVFLISREYKNLFIYSLPSYRSSIVFLRPFDLSFFRGRSHLWMWMMKNGFMFRMPVVSRATEVFVCGENS